MNKLNRKRNPRNSRLAAAGQSCNTSLDALVFLLVAGVVRGGPHNASNRAMKRRSASAASSSAKEQSAWSGSAQRINFSKAGSPWENGYCESFNGKS